MSRGLKWAVGVAVFILLGLWGIMGPGSGYGGAQTAYQIQAKLQDAADNALKASGHEWARVRISGQQATLEGLAPNDKARAEAEQVIKQSYGSGGILHGGITRVLNMATVSSEGPYMWRAVLGGGSVVLSGSVPSEIAQSDLSRAARAMFDGGVADQQKMTADGIPTGNWVGTAKVALEALSLLDEGEAHLNNVVLNISGRADDSVRLEKRLTAMMASLSEPYVGFARVLPLQAGVDVDMAVTDIDICQGRLDQTVAGRSVEFVSGSATLADKTYTFLDGVAGAAAQCPDYLVEISGHTDATGDPDANRQLSQKRAEAVVAYLGDKGIELSRLIAVGYGADQPAADNATASGRAQNRRIEFRVMHKIEHEEEMGQ